MNATDQVDQMIAALPGWRGEMLTRLRALVHAVDPDLVEEWKWDTAVFTKKGMVCALSGFKAHVKLNFFKGASVADPAHLFNAGLDAKASRSIDFHEGDAIDEAALAELIRAAVSLNQGKK
jgi:hypothetical protein